MSFTYVLTLIYQAFAVPLSIVDMRTIRIPSWLTYIGCAAVLVYTGGIRQNASSGRTYRRGHCFPAFFLLREMTHEGLGFGDVRYSLLCGLYNGFPRVLAGCALATLCGYLSFALFYMLKK